MSDQVTFAQIAKALKISTRSAERMATRLGWAFQERKVRGGTQRMFAIIALPAELQSALALTLRSAELAPAALTDSATAYDRTALWDSYSRRPDSLKETAKRRAAIVTDVHRLIGSGYKQHKALDHVAHIYDEKPRTMERWLLTARQFLMCDWEAALCPSYVGRTVIAECNDTAWDIFKGDYLRAEAPTYAACYLRLERAAKRNGWMLPGLSTMRRRMDREISKPVQILARQGADALKALYPAQRRDRSHMHALEGVNADGHKFDVFVKWPDGKVDRPMMVAFQDLATGKLLSFRVDKSENRDSVRLAFGDLVDEHGIPGAVNLDNGRAFASKWITGGTPTRFRFKVREEDPVGCITQLVGKDNIHWATPYHGQAKPIERAFKELAETVSRHPAFAGAYVGNKPEAKPENYGTRAIAIADFMITLKQEIAAHNARPGRSAGICKGRSFDQAFAESYAVSTITKATAEQRRLYLLAAEFVSSKRDGTITISVDRRNRYWCQELHDHLGEQLVARFDPDKLHDRIYIYTADGRYIGEALCIEDAGFMDSTAAREHARARNDYKRFTRSALDAERRMDAAEVAKHLAPQGEATPANAETKLVRIHRPAQPLEPIREQPPVTEEQIAEVVELVRIEQQQKPTEEQRFQRWYGLQQKQEAGEALSEFDAKWIRSYQLTSEFEARKYLLDEFGPERVGLEVKSA